VFNLAWEVFGADAEAIKQATCPSPEAVAQLSSYLMGRQKIDDAIRVWVSLSPAEKKEQREVGEQLGIALIAFKRYRSALEVLRDIRAGEAQPSLGQFLNGGFETDPGQISVSEFGWLIRTAPQAQVAIDENRPHTGSRSLRVTFRAPTKLDQINVSQLVVVAPDTRYRLEFYARTQELRSASTPFIQVLDAADSSLLATSEPLPSGTSDWRLFAFDFKTKPGSEGVLVRIIRAGCGADPVCPIFGTVWYDDFNLQSITGGADAGVARKN